MRHRRRSRDTEGIEGRDMGRGWPLPIWLAGLGERRKLPQRGPWKRFLVHFEANKSHLRYHFNSKTDTPKRYVWRIHFKTATPTANWRRPTGSGAYDPLGCTYIPEQSEHPLFCPLGVPTKNDKSSDNSQQCVFSLAEETKLWTWYLSGQQCWWQIRFDNEFSSVVQFLMKKALTETQTLPAGCRKAGPKIFALPQTRFTGA